MPLGAKLVIGLTVAYVILRLGLWFLKGLATPTPPAPPPGKMRRVDLRYRCSVCGVELRIISAPDEEPPPPRHCLEEMDLVAPIE